MPDNSQGRLKIFLSYAEGVGKTYAMLDEALRRKARGQDVVIGIVDTKGRPETSKLAEEFETIPSLHIRRGDWSTDELDVDAVLKRKPELILVDELAHNNAPGSKNAKRWQDVEQVLEAG